MLHSKPLRSSVIYLVCIALTSLHAVAPTPLQGAQTPAETDREIKIVILDGDKAMNSIKERTANQPVVEVRDEFDRPVSGAEVTFQLPAVGPSASFPGGELQQQSVTNAQGQATTRGMVPNTQPGRFHIKVTARASDRTAAAIVNQENLNIVPEPKAPSASSKWWKYLLIVGAAGGATGALAMSRGGSGSTGSGAAASSIAIIPGNISISAPR